MNDCMECLGKILEELIVTTKNLAKITKGLEERITALEKRKAEE